MVSRALNSGVPLTLSNHSELATQFANFTRQIVNPHKTGSTEKAAPERVPFLGLF